MALVGIIEDDPLFAGEAERRLRADIPDIELLHWENADSFLTDIMPATGMPFKNSPVEHTLEQFGASRRLPDLLLLDLNLPGLSGIELLQKLALFDTVDTPLFQRMPVVVLSSMDSEQHIFDALRYGAVGYILKSEIGDLTAHVTTALEGGGIMSPTIAVRVIENLRTSGQQEIEKEAHRTHEPASATPLTPREEEVLQLLVCGQSARETAAALCVSPHTVRVHIKHIYKKLYVANKAELMREARRMGFF